MLKPWKVLQSKITYEDPWLRVRSDRCETKTGKIIEPYHVLEYPEWVNVVPITSSGEIILVREYRHGAKQILIGLPSGTSERSDKALEQAARRELLEETGFNADTFIPLGSMYANPANQNNRVWSYLAIGIKREKDQSLDENEDIEIVTEPFTTFLLKVWQGKVQFQALYVAALNMAIYHILSSGQTELDTVRSDLMQILLKR